MDDQSTLNSVENILSPMEMVLARLLVEKVIAYKNSSQDIINAYMAVAKIPDEHTGTIILKIA